MLTVAVLGPAEVRVDGQLVTVPSGKNTELLVRLALDAGSSVPIDRILADLWAGITTGVVKNTLQSKVSQLRRALGEPGLIRSVGGGYRLGVEPADVDALRVVALSGTAHQLRLSGDAVGALDCATTGLALFRSAPLSDAGDGEWLIPHRVRLEQLRVGLLEDQLAARVQLGAGPDTIGQLEELVTQYPLREAFWYWLMTALYRNERQADALAAYSRVRQILVGELGLEPGRALQELEKHVLQGDLEPQGTTTGAQQAPRTAVPGNLPRLPSTLIGRESDLDILHRRLQEQRLVTLVGPPGVGKTRLALELAGRTRPAGGCWLIRLDALDANGEVPRAVAETLKLSGEQAVLERVSGAESLLVFDNCEHVIDSAAQFIDRLLDATGQLRVLATSQLPLGLDGEVIYEVDPLPLTDSVLLFTGVATEVRPQLVVDADTADRIARLCVSLDGLPLAIELAAARMKSLSVEEISRRLDTRFDILHDPASRRPERRRALSAALGWSYDLLFPDDQRGLWALSTFAGDAPLAAVEHVLSVLGVPVAAAVDVVTRLVGRSLVQVDTAVGGALRYRLLHSIRAFASDRLRQSTQEATACTAHASWYADQAARCAATVRGPDQTRTLDFARAERANVDSALSWSALHRPVLGVRIVNGLGWSWVVLGDGVAGAGRIRAALTAAALPVSSPDRAKALLLAGWLEASAGDLGVADNDLGEAAVAAEGLQSVELAADGSRHRAFLRLQQGRPVEALALAERSTAADRSLNRDWEEGAGLILAAYASIMLGDVPAAEAAAQAAMLLLEPIGDPWGLVHAQGLLGTIAQARGRFTDAARFLSLAADTSQRLGFLGQQALHLTRLGRVQQQSGDGRLAAATLYRAVAAAEADNDFRMVATAKIHLARLLRGAGRSDDAISLLRQAHDWYRRSGAGDGALLAEFMLVATTSSAGVQSAAERLQVLLDEARRVHNDEVETLALDALAGVAARRGDFDTARALLAAADRRSQQSSVGALDIDRFDAGVARDLVTAAAGGGVRNDPARGLRRHYHSG